MDFIPTWSLFSQKLRTSEKTCPAATAERAKITARVGVVTAANSTAKPAHTDSCTRMSQKADGNPALRKVEGPP